MRKRLTTAIAVLAIAAGSATWYAVARGRRQARLAPESAEADRRDAEARGTEEAVRPVPEHAEAERLERERLAAERERLASRARAAWIERAESDALALQSRECALDAFRQGVELDRAGDEAGAAEAYRRALEADGTVAGAWTNLAILLDRSGRHEEAAVAAGMAIGLPPSADPARRAHAMHVLARAQSHAGREDEAIGTLGRALDAHPGHAPSALAAARIWHARGDPERAIGALASARDAGCADASVELFLSALRRRRGDMEAAAAHAAAAVRLDPASVDAQVALAQAQLGLGRWADAAASLEAAVRRRPDEADLHAALAYSYDRLGRRAEAMRHYDRAVAIDPSHPTAHAHRGAMLEASGRIEDARAAYRLASAAAPSQARSAAQTKLAVEEFLAGNIEAARDLARRAVETDGLNAHARFVLGVAALRLGDRATADAQRQALTGPDPERAEELGKLLAGGPG